PVSTAEDSARAIIFADLNVTDVDNPYPIGFDLTVLPGASYTVSAGTTVTPAANFSGTLSVPVRDSDPDGAGSNPCNLLDTDTPVNDAAVITSQHPVWTPEDTARAIALADLNVTDPDDTYPTGFALTVLPGASYTVSAGTTVTPAANFTGTLSV